jgi:hypothetical protein
MTGREGGATDEVRVELYVRSLLPGQARKQQDAVIDQLSNLEAAGVIDEYSVLVWGKHAPATPAEARTDAGLFALNRVAVFSEWAKQNGLSVEDHFERRTIDSDITADTYNALRFPVMTYAEYRGDDLVFVAPASGETHHFSIPDRLDALASETTVLSAEDPATIGGIVDEPAELQRLERAYTAPPRELTLAPREDAADDS